MLESLNVRFGGGDRFPYGGATAIAPRLVRTVSRRRGRWGASVEALVIAAAVACTSGRGTPPTSVDPGRPKFDPVRATRLQRALEDALAGSGAPGAQAAVVAADGSLWTGAAGLSDRERGTSMTPEHLMVPASISKVYTATLILLLAQDGSLSLDDPIERWLPGTPYAEGVTVRHLLNHTSGIASDDPTLPPVCEPGGCQSYSNGGYNLLGRIVEEASGEPFAEALRERISRPLGLEATFVPLQEEVTGEPATGYEAAGEGIDALELELARGGVDEVGSGGVLATAADVASFGHALLTGRVLEPAMMAELLDFDVTRGLPGSSECGARAAVIRRWGTEGESWIHRGLAGSFVASLEHFPRHDVTVAVIANGSANLFAVDEALNAAALEGSPVVEDALAGGRCQYDIAVRSPEGSSRLITDDARFETAPSWTRDGGVLWSRTHGGDWSDVFFVGPDLRAAMRRLTDGPTNEVFARSSPSDGRIVFASNADGDYEIYAMAPDGSDVVQLTRNTWDDIFPAWSPDGTRIAFTENRDGERIVVMDLDGSDNRAITEGPGDEWPTWSPDGGRIAYQAGGVIWIVPADGGEVVRLPIPQVRVTSFPTWGPNDAIAFESDLDLWSVHADGSELRRLTGTSTEESFPAWGPDGSIVYQIGRWVES